jgi:serine/threonine protein phosphatase PrpC
MLTALQVALDDTARRAHVRLQRLELDIGHELHIGVLKGQYSPVNQDDLFLAFDAASAIGLFMISDGVSISQHGTGDQASGCVRAEVANLWRQLCTPPSITEATTQDAAALGTAHTLPGSDDRDRWGPRLPRSAEDRARLLAGALDAANHRIAERVHEDQPRFLGAAEGIMAATAVGALVEGNRALFFSIGDSRAYLVRNGHISSLMIDDDLTTQLMRLGRAPAVARAVASGGALIRCVGEFEKGENDRLVPVPLQPGFRELMLLPGDRIVVCSDGIPDYGGMDEEVAEDNIRRAVEDAPSAPWAAFELMVLANRGGGGDNISCIVLNFGPAHAGLADTDVHATVGGGA